MEISASVAEQIQGGWRNRAATAYDIVLDMILDGLLPGGTIVEENLLAANRGQSWILAHATARGPETVAGRGFHPASRAQAGRA